LLLRSQGLNGGAKANSWPTRSSSRVSLLLILLEQRSELNPG